MYQYFKIYKPFQVLSQFSPEGDKQTLAHFFQLSKDVYPVGRLDFDSEGLLLLTNNKQLNHRLLHPNFQHQRSYLVQVDGAITDEAIAQLKKGVDINVDGKTHKCSPSLARMLKQEPQLPARNPPIRFRKEIPAPWIELILTEGKNRQVRKMTAKVGFPTLRLVRNSIEGIELDKMQPGEIIQLTEEEVRQKLFGGKSI